MFHLLRIHCSFQEVGHECWLISWISAEGFASSPLLWKETEYEYLLRARISERSYCFSRAPWSWSSFFLGSIWATHFLPGLLSFGSSWVPSDLWEWNDQFCLGTCGRREASDAARLAHCPNWPYTCSPQLGPWSHLGFSTICRLRWFATWYKNPQFYLSSQEKFSSKPSENSSMSPSPSFEPFSLKTPRSLGGLDFSSLQPPTRWFSPTACKL